jgi:hypothetical protein
MPCEALSRVAGMPKKVVFSLPLLQSIDVPMEVGNAKRQEPTPVTAGDPSAVHFGKDKSCLQKTTLLSFAFNLRIENLPTSPHS